MNDDDQQPRVWANFAGLILVVLLLAGGVWLAKVMQKNAKMEDCLMSGRTNCAPIDTSR